MTRRLGFALLCLGLLAWASTAFAAYPGPVATQGGPGVLSRDGTLRFVAANDGSRTLLRAIRRSDGTVARSRSLPSAFGISVLSPNGGYGEGLSHDGKTLVLQSMGFGPRTRFVIIDTGDLSTRDTISLRGTFAYDALSPDGSRLYLIQHTSVQDVEHYIVRAYDLKEHALLPGRIADKTQKSWIMQGWSVSRATTANGRWVYTLYANPGGYPFVHALDTVAGVAHCVGLPWPASDGNQQEVFSFRLALNRTRLVVRKPDGAPYRVVDTRSWRVSKPTAR
jgi:hypothetical protein